MLMIPQDFYSSFTIKDLDWALMEKWTTLPSWATALQKQQLMEQFNKVTFVRHPFARLVSAFQNKVLDHSWFKNKLLKYNSTTEVKDGIPTFSQFVDYVLDQDPKTMNHHFEVMWTRCNVCQIKYDFIGKMETFDQDVSSLLKHVSL